MMDLSDKYLMSIVDGRISSFTTGDSLVVNNYYIDYNDTYKFDNEDLTFYYATSSHEAIAYKANRNNYKVLNPQNKAVNSLYSAITVNGQQIAKIVSNGKIIWQKDKMTFLDLSGGRRVQVSFNGRTITIVFGATPNSKDFEQFFATSNKDLLLTIDNQSYDVVAAEYVKFASLVKFTVTQFSSYKNTTATNVTVAVKTDDTAQSQVLLFDGRPTTTFTKLDLYKTYIFERSGYPPETRAATALDFGYLKLGDGHLLINKSDTGLYIKSYVTAFDVKIYGKN
ncbi:hypothetical protein ACEN48_08350 [Streptococcus pyogenes]